MRGALAALVMLGAMAGAFRTASDGLASERAAGSGGRTPVLVELFTSEGCSSCPPADRLLAALSSDQPVASADIVVVSEHVDYWNRLGWRDPFSSAVFTSRQRAYAKATFLASQIYTPQMVVNGRAELIGSDRSAAIDAITRAAALPAEVAITLSATSDAGGVRAVVHVRPRTRPSGDADVVVAVVEDGLVSNVKAGENAGRRLEHAAVARAMANAGRIGARGAQLDTEVRIPRDAAWSRDRLRAVAFVQDTRDGHVLGAAAALVAVR